MGIKQNKKGRGSLGFLAVEKISLLYGLITGFLILYLFARMDHPTQMLLERVAICGTTIGLMLLGRKWNSKWMVFVRVAFQMALLSYWYPDTYEFNRLFENLDPLFAQVEQAIFGFQPAVVFSRYCSSLPLSEAFHLGYFSYYPMIGVVTLAYFVRRNEEFTKVAFILVGAFLIYYLIYIFVPVAGPQFYFPLIGWGNVEAGVFPSIADAFRNYTGLEPGPGESNGLFYQLVESAQAAGERPTAAFPSSHVGISTILLILSWRFSRGLFGFLLPFYFLLCGATVYIQAHYAIDVLGGWVSAFLIYGLVLLAYNKLFQGDKNKKLYD